MKILKWMIAMLLLAGVVAYIVLRPIPFLFYQDLPYLGVVGRAIFIILLCSLMCLYRIWKGPTGADRIVAMDILGIMIVGFCSILSISTGRFWYIDIGIAWALQSFICALALAKYLEGKGFDE